MEPPACDCGCIETGIEEKTPSAWYCKCVVCSGHEGIWMHTSHQKPVVKEPSFYEQHKQEFDRLVELLQAQVAHSCTCAHCKKINKLITLLAGETSV